MGIAGNVWKLQADRFFSNFWIYGAILVPFFEANGLKASQTFLTETIFAFVLAASEIPTGYLSDVIGRRKCFIIGSSLIPVAITVYACSHTFWGFAAAESLLAVALSFRSGTDTSFLYDTLLELKREKEHKHIEGTALFLKSMGSSVAGILGGLLSIVSLVLPFIVNIFTSLVLVPLAIATKEPKRESKKSQSVKAHVKDMSRAIQYCAKHQILRNAVLYFALINGISMISYWLNYIFYSRLDISVGYFGFLAAFSSLVAAMGSKLLHRIDKRFGERFALTLPLLMGVSLLSVSLIPSLWALPFIFLNHFLWGLSIPLLQDIMHKNTPSSIRATVMSLANMGGRLVFIALSAATGFLVDVSCVQTGYLVLGGVFLATTVLPALGLIRQSKP